MTFKEFIESLNGSLVEDIMDREIKTYDIHHVQDGGVSLSVALGVKKKVPENYIYEKKYEEKPVHQTFGDYLSKYGDNKTLTYDPTEKKLVVDQKELERKAEVTRTDDHVGNERSFKRHILFKSNAEAVTFAKEWDSYFDNIESKSGHLYKYKITRNTFDNDMYKIGYMWVCSFRMNKKNFDSFEGLLELEKRDRQGKGRGGSCIRLYKGVKK